MYSVLDTSGSTNFEQTVLMNFIELNKKLNSIEKVLEKVLKTLNQKSDLTQTSTEGPQKVLNVIKSLIESLNGQ